MIDYSQDFLRQKDKSDGIADSWRSEIFRAGVPQCLYIRTDLPRGEFQYGASRVRILDDRAGNGVRRAG